MSEQLITSITDEQQAYFDKLIEQELHDITDFKETIEAEAIRACEDMAADMKLPKPKVVFGNNPKETILLANEYSKGEGKLDENGRAEGLDRGYVSLWWRYWRCLYKFGEHIGVKFDTGKLDLFDRFLTHCYHVVPYEEVWFVSRNPIKAHYVEGNLHRDGGPAVEFLPSENGDTFGIYSLNGIRVPEYLAMTDSGKLSTDFFNTETNADVKAEFLRKYGIERMIDHGKKIDSFENYPRDEAHEWWYKSEYELYDMESLIDGSDYAPYLKMKNQTVGIWHVEGVHPDCTSVRDALRFTEVGVVDGKEPSQIIGIS